MDEQRASSLEDEVQHGIDVIVKLTQFSGSEKSINTLIDREIERLTKQHNGCQKSPQPHASSDCPQHKKLEELRKKLETLKQNKENHCETLLNNLCSGLEKFLGYQETSKGYDGSGIVYSDLDRLCDGVMAFLHGVLDGVKDDDNVAAYDVKDTENINKVISDLHDNVGKGRQAFPEAVTQVEKATGGVKDKLGKYYNQAYDQTDLNGQLHEWTKTLQGISTELTIIETQQINDLDKSLSTRIMHKIEPIQKSVEVLLGAAREEGLKSKVKEVDDALWKQEQKVRTSVGNLRIEKREKFDIIKKAIKDAQHFMDNGFDWEYRSKILGCFTAIKDAIINAYDSLKQKKNYLDGLVMDAQEHVYQIKIGIGTESISFGDTVYGGWGLLKIEIKKLVGQIKGEPGEGLVQVQNNSGLKQIVEGVEAYANGFENEAFSKVLQKWIDEIVNDADEGIVGSKIKNYVTFNQNNGKLSAEVGSVKSKTVRQAIIAELPAFIHGDVKTAAVSTLKNTKVNNIDEQLSAFAARIESELTNDRDSSIGSAVQAIEEKLGLKGVTNNYRQYLTAAVKAIANSIIKNFMQVAEELKRFAKDSHIANLTQIGNNVDNIKKYFDGTKAETINGTTNYGKKIDDALAKVKDEIEALDGLLGVKVGQDGSIQKKLNEIQEELEIKYKLHVIEWNTRDADEALTHAIDEIDKVVRDAFSTLTAEVRALFAQGHKADLAALKTLVEEQEKEIDKIIKHDKSNGVKGLLKWMYDKAGSRINALGSALTPSPAPAVKTQGNTEDRTKLKNVSDKFREYSDIILDYIGGQARNPSAIVKPTEQSLQVGDIKDAFDRLIKYVAHHDDNKYTFDHISTSYLDALNASLHKLSPSHFHGFHNPLLLDALKSGMSAFTKQLGHAYVNRYSGQKGSDDWVITNTKKNNDPSQPDKVLSTEGRNCAKVCLTILETLLSGLDGLKDVCKKRFSKSTISRSSDLGELFKSYGYRVASHSKSQDGELKRHEDMTGEKVFQKLHEMKFTSSDKIEHLKECESNEVDVNSKKKKHDNFDIFDLLKCLHRHLEEYYSVGHIATFTSMKQPCSVNEMLSWFSGLPYNAAYSTLLRDGFTSLLQKPKPKTIQGGDEFEVELDDLKSYYIDAYPNRITYDHINTALDHICSISYDILTSIAGHGDEYTTYAADFCTNHLSLSYPSIPSQCLDMLLDILRRLLPQLRYLFNRCKLSTKHSGWSQCLYGRDVFTTKSPCNNHSNSKPNSRPKCQPTCQANTKPNCQPTSPLMSYLTDSLPGHLPHDVSSIGCRSVCSTCPNGKKGMPCLTPLGFRGFSGSTRKGEEICDILDKFFSNFYLSSLFCLSPKTPASLPEQFGFVLSLVSGWNSPKTEATSRIKKSVESSIESVSINLYDQPTKLTAALTNAYRNTHSNHGGKDHLPAYSDVYSLAMTSACNDRVGKALCAPYVASLCGDTYAYFAEKHCNTYLSWAIYLPWTFWDLLNNLYNSFCSITCADWGCRGCLRGDKCKSGKHGVVEDEKNQDATCQCDSIVKCRGVAPTLYQYGFTFGEASTLNSGSTVKKCSDFCSQLRNVLHSEYFQKLFEECDNFLKAIRWPFMLTLLALWSLSLLYLLHIAVVRLDVLRIRSHLRSPSSHRIAAQSLLAAARVKALANVKYFSP
ncbi:hypothetical protein, conserved [Babesia ovata]|uniref:C3H1-type domain-containing protein n=1 Tax=Babesia ovata TaxID=189622 RepID=A0A2H6KIX6_9APIC|nr:uncharacterized protein BOVATA_044370 [Babesia ovata]GBE62944.1 hypothetical protein, conserved [Babesia ovata]